MDPLPSGFECARGQLIVAAVVIAAEPKVARNYDDDFVAKHIGSLLAAAGTQLVGCWQGSSLG